VVGRQRLTEKLGLGFCGVRLKKMNIFFGIGLGFWD